MPRWMLLLLGGGLVMLTTASVRSAGPGQDVSANALFVEALRAAPPAAGRGGSSDMFTPLIGDWDAEVVDHLPGGITRRQSAEIHFAWVLEGRAIQDVWIVPARHERLKGDPSPSDGNRYGTTLRVYDPDRDAWGITWVNPVTRVETRLVGRRVGAQIVQTGADADGRLIRWVFVDLRSDRFHWRGERSADGGRTWITETEYFARRRVSPADPAADDAISESRAAWVWIDRPGLETLRLVRRGTGTTADGNILVFLDGSPIRVRYTIEHDAGWHFRRARIETDRAGSIRVIDIRHQNGTWSVDGTARADLEGCEDLDVAVTPYTNTPAIAAHPLAPRATRRLRVAWVQVPGFDIHPVEQEYTRLDSSGGVVRYRYRNLQSGFTGELTLGA
ncbi:MAG TPA: putative glycolipid-binding domain-containing protein, partial [Gemmatimonadaceae bacterium]